MVQFFIAIAAFALLPLLIGKWKLKVGPAILICCGLIQLLALHSLPVLWDTVKNVFTLANINAVVSIALIGVLSGLMKRYGLLEDIVSPAKTLIRSRKVLMGLIPAVIGLLSVPGGAYLSAPFADELGEEMGIPKPRRAALNLVYRHIAMFLSPFSTFQVYIASRIAVTSYQLIPLFAPFAGMLALLGAVLYMPGKSAPGPKVQGGRGKALSRLLRGLSPILLVIVLSGLLGLPMSAALVGSLALVFFLSDKKDFLKNAWASLKLDVALMILAVYFAQNTVMALSDIRDMIASAFTGGGTILMMAVVAGGSLFLGFITGQYYVALGVFLPILAAVSQGAVALPLLFFICVWVYMGYFYSPLHPCQLLTLQYMGVSQGQVYKEHARIVPWLAAATVCLYFLYSLLL